MEISIYSPLTFAKLLHKYMLMCKILSLNSKIVWSIIYDQANKPYEMSIYLETFVQTNQWKCAGSLLIDILFMLREMGWRWAWIGVMQGSECEYWGLDWKVIKLATALHHSTTVPELSLKCNTLQAAITEAYRSPQWHGSALNRSGQRWRLCVCVPGGGFYAAQNPAATETSTAFPEQELKLKCR